MQYGWFSAALSGKFSMDVCEPNPETWDIEHPQLKHKEEIHPNGICAVTQIYDSLIFLPAMYPLVIWFIKMLLDIFM
jgi:hypothetical protein